MRECAVYADTALIGEQGFGVCGYLFRWHACDLNIRGSAIVLCVFSGDPIAAIHEELSKYRLPSLVLHDVPAIYRELFLHTHNAADLASIKG